jgi:hypothetical protein
MDDYSFPTALLMAVLAGSLLRQQSARLYWTLSCLLASLLSAALAVHVAKIPGPPHNSPAVLAAAFVGAPMLAAFGVQRLARTAPYTIVAAGLGLVVYVLMVLFMMTLTVNVGLLSP